MTERLRISAADLGTNTLKVTHATRIAGDELTDMAHASNTVRLGAGIENTGKIEEHRIDECLQFLKDEEAVGRAHGSNVFIGVATEALRIASNGQVLLDRIHAETGWKIEIISGDREAELTYLGLKDMVPAGMDCAIVDIGGGSTEVVVINNSKLELSQSLAVGSGRLADRFFGDDPPGDAAEGRAIAAAKQTIADNLAQPVSCGFIMLAGGSGLFMNLLIEQLWGEPPFDVSTLKQLAQHLANTPAEDTVTRIGIPLARALILPASVAVGVAIMEHFGATQAIGVPSGIRMGLIRQYQTAPG